MADWRKAAIPVTQPESGAPQAAAQSASDWRKAAIPVESQKQDAQTQSTQESQPEDYSSEDVFGSDQLRAAASFGDPKGIKKLVEPLGFSDVSKDKNGDLIFKNKNGQWVKDASNFFGKGSGLLGYLPEHPINWVESKTGKALPVLGMMTGGAVGAPLGGIPGAMVGGGAGAMFGEGLRQAAGRYMGVADDDASDAAKEVATEGLLGALGEGGGRAVSPYVDPYIKTAVENASNLVKKGVSKTSSILTGIPSEAIERLIERPAQVLGAEEPGNALNVAEKAREELLEKNKLEGELSRSARDKFRSEFGQQDADTKPIIDDILKFRTKNAPNEQGFGALTEAELENLSRFEKDALTRKNIIKPEIAYVPNEERLAFGKPQEQSWYKPEPDINPGTFANESKFSDFQSMGKELKQRAERKALADLEAANVFGVNPYDETKIPVQSVERSQVYPKKVPKIIQEEVSEQIPKIKAQDLHKLADYLDSQITSFDQSKLPGSGDTRYQAYLRSLRHQIKERLHEIDPNGLKVADKRFSDYATKASRLGKLEDEDQMESFINNYFGKNKALMRESAQEILPKSLEGIKDIGAARAFTKQGPAGSEMGARRLMSAFGGGLLGAQALYKDDPILAALAAVASTSTSPQLNKAIIGRLSQLAGSNTAKTLKYGLLGDTVATRPFGLLQRGLLK